MYTPRDFDRPDPAWCHGLMTAESFATLVTVDERGTPFATHLPFLLDAGRGPLGTLVGHVARANPQWRGFASGREAVVVFQGPHAYVSPAWYAVHPSVPTWNYVAVHAYGVPRVIEEPADVKAVLARLVATYERDRPDAWRFASLPDEYVDRMIAGIVAFDIPIGRLEGKAKLSQNRTAVDRARVIAGLRAAGGPRAAALAHLMAEATAG